MAKASSIRWQSCKSGRAFRVGFGLGSGLRRLFVLGVQKNNQNNLAISLNFLDLTQLSGFFGHDLGFKLIFGFGPGSGLNLSARLQLCTVVRSCFEEKR